MTPVRRNLLLAGSLLVTAGLAVAVVRTRTQRIGLDGRIAVAAAEIAALAGRTEQLRREVAAEVEGQSEQRVRATMLLPAAERARRVVGVAVERLKAQHRAHPPPAPLPAPPSPPESSSSGTTFPELMGNPDYARGLFVFHRHLVDNQHRQPLEAIGCDARTVNQALDLLTEREMLRYDIRSIDAEASPQSTNATERKLRSELEQQLRQLLGPARYAQLEEPDGNVTLMIKPDGTVERRSSPGIPPTRAISVARAAVDLVANRLSYSAAPLDAAQRQALLTALADHARANQTWRLSAERWKEPALAAVFAAVLQPGQMPAVESLNAEAIAYHQRARLPKP